MSEVTGKVPMWFWIVGILALIWNLIGASQYIAQVTMGEAELSAMTEAMRALYEATPAWVNGAFAIAVFGGAIGSLLLLLKSKLATWALIASLAGVIAQQSYIFFGSNTLEVMGTAGTILPILVLVIAVALVIYARSCTAKGSLR